MSKNILIVEDDEAIRFSMIDLLEMESYEVHSCDNGQKALDYLASCSKLPDLILLDLMMPVMDGFAFCERQIKDAAISHIPVIIMSADGHVKEKQNKTHSFAYLRKPLDIDCVLQTIEDALKTTVL
ncbi:MAG TPA: response regulator [Bacteriovoracaceae bacterium]|nr:response regulator [Bacteriovoracaceae bacterium]